MFRIKHILAIVDSRHERHYALPRAVDLARKFGSRITVVSNVYETSFDFLSSSEQCDEIKQQVIKENNTYLKTITSELDIEGLDIDYHSIWSPHLKEEISNYIGENAFDLVLKTTRQHSLLKKILFTPTDWHLLREQQTNVLFVHKGITPKISNIMASINIDDDQQHSELNERILTATTSLTDVYDSRSNVLNVFPWTLVQFGKFKHLFKDKDFFTFKKEAHRAKVNEVVEDILSANSAKLNGKVIVAEGLEPEVAIPALLESSKVDLLVMGTVGRSGLDAAVIGNTAEIILDEINCDVLAIK